MKNKAKHLSYWNDDLDIETFKKWCGNPNAKHKQEVRRFIINNNFKSVLDVGAGTFSEYYGFIEDNYDIEYTAVEITEKYVEHGKAKGINVHLATAADLPFENESFDVVLCLAVLNHQLDYKKEIEEMLRVAKKGVIISFFKPFEEDVLSNLYSPDWKGWVDRSTGRVVNCDGSYKLRKTDYGLVEDKGAINGKTACVHYYFNKKKLLGFLDSLDIKYWLTTASDKKIMLLLSK